MTAGAASLPSADSASARGALRGRLTVLLLGGLSWLLRRLPDRQLHRLAGALGRGVYLVQPRRRALVRENLARVCGWLAANGLASAPVVAATEDGRRLEALVRSAFGHYLRSYLESLIVERYAQLSLADRITADDPERVAAVFGKAALTDQPRIMVGMHFGAIEIPALWATSRGLRLTAPMETIGDPALQAFLLRRRGVSGLRLVPTAGAHRVLAHALASGEGVAIVADRPVAGVGARVELFGAPARLPLGPAVLALETGAPAWAIAVRRTNSGDYRARIEPIALPAEGTRRERLAGFLSSQARAIEQLVADAPEQWWTLLFPIWEEQSPRRRGEVA